MIGETLETMMEQFTRELAECTANHNYEKLYVNTCVLIKGISEMTGEPMTGTDFFESLGYGCLSQKNYEKAYVLFRTGAQYCSSRVAQFNLGNLFLSGDGVKSNLAAAYYWFFKASQNTVEEGAVMCDRILKYVAEEGNPLSNILYGGKDTALPGLRRAMNVGMFLDSMISLCEKGCDMFPQDEKTAEYLRERRPHLMEAYK